MFPPVSSCVSPAMVGGRQEWVWDSLTTDRMAEVLLQSLGLEAAAEEIAFVRTALDDAVAAVTSYPRWLTAGEASRVAEESLALYRRASAHA